MKARDIWLGAGLWGLTLLLVPDPLLGQLFMLVGSVCWLGLCVIGTSVILWKIEDWIDEREL